MFCLLSLAACIWPQQKRFLQLLRIAEFCTAWLIYIRVPLALLALRAIVCGMPQMHCQGVVIQFKTVALLLQLRHHLLQLLRLSFSAGQVLNSVVLYGNSALEDAVVVLQLCQLTLEAAEVQSILRDFTTILSHSGGCR